MSLQRTGRLQSTYLICVCAAALSFQACSTTPRSVNERVAVIPFDNQTSDPGLDWAARALTHIIVTQTEGAKPFQTFEASNLRDAQTARATQIVQGYITVERGVLRAYATIRSEGRRKAERTISATGPIPDLLALGSTLARELGPVARPYTTASVTAIRELFSGAPDKALEADSGYGAAHIARLQTVLRTRDRSQIASAIEAARKARLTDSQRAGLELVAAEIEGNRSARIAALTKAADSSPSDPQVWRAIAELQMQAKDYPAAAAAYSRVLDFSPDDQVALNSRGYALAFAGDLEGARKTLEEYRRVAPNSANPLDSLAEVEFYFGRYSEAETHFLQAHEKDANNLGGVEPFRAALSRFLAGDVAKADADFKRFLDARRQGGDALADIRQAIWLRLTGRRTSPAGQASIDQAMEALWELLDGDRDAARRRAEGARASATLPNAANFSGTVLLLAQPSASPEVWRERVDRALTRPEQAVVRKQVLGFALLLDRQFGEAAKVWRDIYDQASGLTANDERIALAWALMSSGQIAEARKLIAGFLPPPTLDPGLNMLLYRKAIELRAGRH